MHYGARNGRPSSFFLFSIPPQNPGVVRGINPGIRDYARIVHSIAHRPVGFQAVRLSYPEVLGVYHLSIYCNVTGHHQDIAGLR